MDLRDVGKETATGFVKRLTEREVKAEEKEIIDPREFRRSRDPKKA